jgi:hypothetical protein
MNKLKRVVGYVSLGLGCVSVVFGLSPIIPTVLDAVLLGGAFFSLGAWALAGPRIGRMYRTTIGKLKTRQKEEKTAIVIDPLLPVRILKLAKERAGTLTISDVAISLNIPLPQAEEGLKACVRSGNALADFDLPLGYAIYRFPEFLPPEERKLILG